MTPDAAGTARALVRVEGHVQGVGFRWWVARQAEHLGLSGYAANLPNGSVEVQVQGPSADVEAMVALLTGPGVPGRPGRVRGYLVDRRAPDPSFTGFEAR